MSAWLIMTTLPDAESAQAMAEYLVSHRLAACVNQLAPCQSVYQWQGKVERASEFPLLIKINADRYAEVEAAICAQHPYAVPEIIAVPVAAGLPAYLDWLHKETPPC